MALPGSRDFDAVDAGPLPHTTVNALQDGTVDHEARLLAAEPDLATAQSDIIQNAADIAANIYDPVWVVCPWTDVEGVSGGPIANHLRTWTTDNSYYIMFLRTHAVPGMRILEWEIDCNLTAGNNGDKLTATLGRHLPTQGGPVTNDPDANSLGGSLISAGVNGFQTMSRVMANPARVVAQQLYSMKMHYEEGAGAGIITIHQVRLLIDKTA
jgi:hypothetical protein